MSRDETREAKPTFVVAAWIKMPIDAIGYVDFTAKPGSITHLQQDRFWKSRTVRPLGDVTHFADSQDR